MMTEDEWFAAHPWLDRDWWLGIDHSQCDTYFNEEIDPDAPDYQKCRYMHCPRCDKKTGSQGHRVCP